MNGWRRAGEGYYYGNCTFSLFTKTHWHKVLHASVTQLILPDPRCLICVSHCRDIFFCISPTQCKQLTCTKNRLNIIQKWMNHHRYRNQIAHSVQKPEGWHIIPTRTNKKWTYCVFMCVYRELIHSPYGETFQLYNLLNAFWRCVYSTEALGDNKSWLLASTTETVLNWFPPCPHTK